MTMSIVSDSSNFSKKGSYLMKKGQLLAANYQNYIGNDGSPIKNLPGVDENPEDEDQCNVATEEEENPANITHEPSEIIAQALTEEPIITIHQS